MSESFLDGVRNWLSEIKFPSMRSSTAEYQLKTMARHDPAMAVLYEVLKRMRKDELVEADVMPSPFYPPNIAGVLEAMGIDTAEKFRSVLGGKASQFITAHLIPYRYEIDKKSLPLIVWNELKAEIQNQCYAAENFQFFTGDTRYYLCPKDIVADVLRYTPVKREPYLYEVLDDGRTKKMVHDCDNYALELAARFSKPDLAGMAFGQCWLYAKDETGKISFGHAINIFCDENKKVWLVEPQLGVMFEPKAEHQVMDKHLKYKLYFALFV